MFSQKYAEGGKTEVNARVTAKMPFLRMGRMLGYIDGLDSG